MRRTSEPYVSWPFGGRPPDRVKGALHGFRPVVDDASLWRASRLSHFSAASLKGASPARSPMPVSLTAKYSRYRMRHIPHTFK